MIFKLIPRKPLKKTFRSVYYLNLPVIESYYYCFKMFFILSRLFCTISRIRIHTNDKRNLLQHKMYRSLRNSYIIRIGITFYNWTSESSHKKITYTLFEYSHHAYNNNGMIHNIVCFSELDHIIIILYSFLSSSGQNQIKTPIPRFRTIDRFCEKHNTTSASR